MKLTADGVTIHDYIRMGTRRYVRVSSASREVTRMARYCFTWTCGQDDSGEGERGSQVAEIWLIRNKNKLGL